MDVLEGELQTVRETYNSKQDAWLKEKLQLQVFTSLQALSILIYIYIHV